MVAVTGGAAAHCGWFVGLEGGAEKDGHGPRLLIRFEVGGQKQVGSVAAAVHIGSDMAGSCASSMGWRCDQYRSRYNHALRLQPCSAQMVGVSFVANVACARAPKAVFVANVTYAR